LTVKNSENTSKSNTTDNLKKTIKDILTEWGTHFERITPDEANHLLILNYAFLMP